MREIMQDKKTPHTLQNIAQLLASLMRIGLKLKLIAYFVELKALVSQETELARRSLPRMGFLLILLTTGIITTWGIFLVLGVFLLHSFLSNWERALSIIMMINLAVTVIIFKKLYGKLENLSFRETRQHIFKKKNLPSKNK